MSKYIWAMASGALVVLLGASLTLWPFLVHTNIYGWTSTTRTEFWSGIGLIVVGILMLAAWYGDLKRSLIAAGIIAPRTAAEPATPAPTPAAPTDDLDRLLRPLAETVLRDLTQQLAAKERAEGGTKA